MSHFFIQIATVAFLFLSINAFAQDPREVPSHVPTSPRPKAQQATKNDTSSSAEKAKQQASYIVNKRLIDQTKPISAAYDGGNSYENYAGFRRETFFQPQNAGEILYADEKIIIAARTNAILTGTKVIDRKWKRVESIAVAQMPLCYHGTAGSEFWVASKSWAGENKSIPVHSMDLIAILNVPMDYKITRKWLWAEFQKILRKGVTDRFCGGRTQSVSVEFHIQGVQHNQKGIVQNTDDIEYPSTESLLDKLNTMQASAYSAVRTAIGDYSGDPFLRTRFIFWDKLAPEYKSVIPVAASVPSTSPNILRKNNKGAYIPRRSFSPSIGTYYDVFYPIWASEANINKLVEGGKFEFAESASYSQFLSGRKIATNKEIEIRRAREAAKFDLAKVLLALARAQGVMRCLPDMQSDGTVFDEDKQAWQEKNCR